MASEAYWWDDVVSIGIHSLREVEPPHHPIGKCLMVFLKDGATPAGNLYFPDVRKSVTKDGIMTTGEKTTWVGPNAVIYRRAGQVCEMQMEQEYLLIKRFLDERSKS